MPTKRSHILEQTFLFKYVWPFSGHQALELKKSILTSLSSYRLPRDLKPHYLIKFLMEWYLYLTAILSRCSELAAKVFKKHVFNLYPFTSIV